MFYSHVSYELLASSLLSCIESVSAFAGQVAIYYFTLLNFYFNEKNVAPMCGNFHKGF